LFGKIVNVPSAHQYARIERERRFLVAQLPPRANVVAIRHIRDFYLDGTALRLREQTEETGATIFKLTQKIPARAPGAQQGFITTMYLSKAEFAVLAQLPGKALRKTRYSVPPFGIDVFGDPLSGLLLAEAEFDEADAADSLALPPFLFREVSADDRFTGGRLARASRPEVQNWLLEYGTRLSSPEPELPSRR
jgi:CYTH domain-containing protein